MITANITFEAEHGQLKLEGCTKSAFLQELEKQLVDFEDLEIGKPKRVIIDIIKQ